MAKTNSIKVNNWPYLFIFIGTAFIMLTGWAIYRASIGVSPVSDPEYYSQGLKYTQSNIELKTAEAAGWTLNTTLDGHELVADLSDSGSAPVSGCSGTLVIYYSNTSARRSELSLKEKSPGNYSILLPPDLDGSITGDLSLFRNGARINRRLIITFK